jgi:hypothetical protein
VRYSREAITRKIERGLWRHAVDDELGRFRAGGIAGPSDGGPA